jgi:hypothetical protein
LLAAAIKHTYTEASAAAAQTEVDAHEQRA